MAWIKKQGHKETKVPYKHDERSKPFYSSKAWRILRDTYLQEHPLCLECLSLGKTKPAEHIHHRKPFLLGKDEELRWELFLDWKNLESLCSECHHAIHNEMRKGKDDV